MSVLTDTNIFLRLLQPHHPHSAVAKQAIKSLRQSGEVLHTTTQNLVELWAVATRPGASNGLGFSPEQARSELNQFRRFWTIVPEVPLFFEEWQRIVTTHGVSGKATHDARLVAAMYVHGIESILTFNVNDFTRYPRITVLNPATIL